MRRARALTVVISGTLAALVATFGVVDFRRGTGTPSDQVCEALATSGDTLAAWALSEEALLVVAGAPVTRLTQDMDRGACDRAAPREARIRILNSTARRNLWGGKGEYPALVIEWEETE